MITPKCHSWLLDKVKKNVDSEENLSVPKLKKILKCQIKAVVLIQITIISWDFMTII